MNCCLKNLHIIRAVFRLFKSESLLQTTYEPFIHIYAWIWIRSYSRVNEYVINKHSLLLLLLQVMLSTEVPEHSNCHETYLCYMSYVLINKSKSQSVKDAVWSPCQSNVEGRPEKMSLTTQENMKRQTSNGAPVAFCDISEQNPVQPGTVARSTFALQSSINFWVEKTQCLFGLKKTNGRRKHKNFYDYCCCCWILNKIEIMSSSSSSSVPFFS